MDQSNININFLHSISAGFSFTILLLLFLKSPFLQILYSNNKKSFDVMQMEQHFIGQSGGLGNFEDSYSLLFVLSVLFCYFFNEVRCSLNVLLC